MTSLTLKVEAETLYGIIDDLNYYQILRLTQDCLQSEIARAYKVQASHFHSQHFEGEDILDEVQYIGMSIKEAYQTLKEIEGRLQYDLLLTKGQHRIQDTKLTRGQSKQNAMDPRTAATNDKSKKYWILGLQAFTAKSYDNAILQIQFALQFEPNNDIFLEYLDKAKEAAKKAPKKNKNPYKLRL